MRAPALATQPAPILTTSGSGDASLAELPPLLGLTSSHHHDMVVRSRKIE